MNFIELAASEKDKFNSFVADHVSGSFLQGWEWGQWQEELCKTVSRFVVENDSGEILLAAQVLKTKIPKLGKYYLYIPYGPLLRDEGLGMRDELINFFIDELKKKFPDAIFIRIEPKQNLIANRFSLLPTPHIQPGKTLIMDLNKSEEELLAGMHSKTRYNIKVAEKHEVKVVSEPIITPKHGLHLSEVAELLVSTAGRQGYKSHGLNYYKKFIDFFGMQPNSETKLTVYKALYKQELLACGLMVDFGETRTYLFGGTAPQNRNVMAAYALHFQAMLEAKKTGLKTYDFWGIETAGGETPGFVRFKLGFGGTEVIYPKAEDIINQPLWYNAYKILRAINKKLSK